MSTPLPGSFPAASPEWGVDLVEGPTQREDAPRLAGQRSWFGWTATSLPIAPLLLLGMLLGPQGLFLLTPGALSAVDPALPVALATLGALVGLLPGLQGPLPHSLKAPGLSVAMTLIVVSVGFSAGAYISLDRSRMGMWLIPLVLGIAAASSLIVPIDRSQSPQFGRAATSEAEALVSVVAGGVLLAFARQETFAGSVLWLVQVCAIVTVLGFAGLLLLRQSPGLAERRVFAVATLLLVGGAADSLSFSALLAGVCAGLLWKRQGGLSRDSLERDLLYALHPLVALVLVVAGARVELSTTTFGLAAGYTVLRSVGRIAAGWLLRPPQPSAGYQFSLLTPGIFGIAFVLNAFRALGSDLTSAVSIVVLGTILSEIKAFIVLSRGGGR